MQKHVFDFRRCAKSKCTTTAAAISSGCQEIDSFEAVLDQNKEITVYVCRHLVAVIVNLLVALQIVVGNRGGLALQPKLSNCERSCKPSKLVCASPCLLQVHWQARVLRV